MWTNQFPRKEIGTSTTWVSHRWKQVTRTKGKFRRALPLIWSRMWGEGKDDWSEVGFEQVMLSGHKSQWLTNFPKVQDGRQLRGTCQMWLPGNYSFLTLSAGTSQSKLRMGVRGAWYRDPDVVVSCDGRHEAIDENRHRRRKNWRSWCSVGLRWTSRDQRWEQASSTQ